MAVILLRKYDIENPSNDQIKSLALSFIPALLKKNNSDVDQHYLPPPARTRVHSILSRAAGRHCKTVISTTNSNLQLLNSRTLSDNHRASPIEESPTNCHELSSFIYGIISLDMSSKTISSLGRLCSNRKTARRLIHEGVRTLETSTVP